MNLFILFLSGILFFLLTTFARRWRDPPVLIAVSIGASCNANLYTPLNSGIEVGPFVFSMAPILYTLFMYTIVVRNIDYDAKKARIMMVTAVSAIIISGLIEFSTMTAYCGEFTWDNAKYLLFYLITSIGTIVGCLFISWKFDNNTKFNKYIRLLVSVLVASLIHGLTFFAGLIVVDQEAFKNMFVNALAGELIETLFFTGIGVLCYFLNNKYITPNYTPNAKN